MRNHFFDLETGLDGSCGDSGLTMNQLDFYLRVFWPDWEREVGCEGCQTVWNLVSTQSPVNTPGATYDPCFKTYHGGGGEGPDHCSRYVPADNGKAGIVQCSIARVTTQTSCNSHSYVREPIRAQFAYVYWAKETSGSGHSAIDEGDFAWFAVVNDGEVNVAAPCHGTSGTDRDGYGVVGVFTIDYSPCGNRKVHGYWAAGISYQPR